MISAVASQEAAMRVRAKEANLATKKANEILLAFKKLDAQRELEADAAIAGRPAVLHCAVLCCAVLCCAVLTVTTHGMLLHTGKTHHANDCNKSAKAFHVAVLPVLQLCLSVPVVMQHMLSRRLSWQRKESAGKQKERQPRKPDGRPCVTTWSTTSCRSVPFVPFVACRLRLQGSIFDSLF